jgi:hypothetical protein
MQRIVISVIALFGLFVVIAITAYKQIEPIDQHMGKCPEGFYYSPEDNDGCVPIGAVTEINGVSVDKILKVLDAHRTELHAIKGVTSTGICRHGIFVEVESDHDKLPATVGGLSVHTHPSIRRVAADLLGYGSERGR